MSGFNEQDLIQFWKDANSYQSIDVACFDIEEFKDNWVRDKIGHEALKKANGATTGEKQCNLPVVNGWRLFQNEAPPLNKEIEVAELGYPMKRKITIAELQFYKWNNYCWREV